MNENFWRLWGFKRELELAIGWREEIRQGQRKKEERREKRLVNLLIAAVILAMLCAGAYVIPHWIASLPDPLTR